MPGRKNTTWCWTWALQREGLVHKEDSWESRINEQREDEKGIEKRRIWEMANETERRREWRFVPSLSYLSFPFLLPSIFNPRRPTGTCRSSSHHPICLLTFTCPCFLSHLPSPDLLPSHRSWISATCRWGRCCEISLSQVLLSVIGQQDDETMEWVMRMFVCCW